MTTWQDFEYEAPDLAPLVRARFEANRHHVLATLRRGGAPRVSGTEVRFIGADLTVGSMDGAVKALDLRRDGRFALHSNPGDGSMDDGDAKVSGTAVEITDPAELAAYEGDLAEAPPGPFHAFRLEPEEVVLTTVEGDRLVIRSWRRGMGVRRFERT
ncbi:pyridoxamine 5'-phosphate oxidase family protein [Kitasatospora sp. DSM 101779]|uniref:pyridoxamine 5'-phosphate oxidase family protein n=1 Tax=Kitasatospora sp. DSM 101779 TaxID=2853165 RepID=UPI0021D91451|nr:pyridoxamine 5'-phosphate oxidase family protein [Kitasatospora sp. DSM 101779]MCU7825152.1 pyridoxamine 5'-phosphate oxidase family protein [Kitasatospora sp. DSM 101779]